MKAYKIGEIYWEQDLTDKSMFIDPVSGSMLHKNTLIKMGGELIDRKTAIDRIDYPKPSSKITVYTNAEEPYVLKKHD